MPKHKNCSKCGEKYPITFFYKDKRQPDGHRPDCKICKSECDKLYRERNKETIHKNQRKYYRKNADKIRERSKKWNINNPEKAKKNKRTWHVNNKEKVDFHRKKHLDENKEFYDEYQRTYKRNRYRTNLNCRIKSCLNKRLRDYVTDKNYPTLDYLGIPMKLFKKWIEFQFEDDMSWENMGKHGWSFDHVIPCDSFDFSNENEIMECYNWENLRPCWCSDNSSKGNRINKKLEALQKWKVNEFLKIYKL